MIFDKSSAAIEFDEELVDAIAGFNFPFTFIIRCQSNTGCVSTRQSQVSDSFISTCQVPDLFPHIMSVYAFDSSSSDLVLFTNTL